MASAALTFELLTDSGAKSDSANQENACSELKDVFPFEVKRHSCLFSPKIYSKIVCVEQ